MSQVIKIKTGTYFGECIGYCNEELVVSTEGAKYTLTTNFEDEAAPSVSGPITIKGDTWNRLTEALDLEALRRLPNTIGCPDCADNGGEWVEVQFNDTTKRVDFEFETAVPGLDELLAMLRALREEGARKYRPR